MLVKMVMSGLKHHYLSCYKLLQFSCWLFAIYWLTYSMVSKENFKKGDLNMEYIYGVHCGNENCYACATQRHKCEHDEWEEKWKR